MKITLSDLRWLIRESVLLEKESTTADKIKKGVQVGGVLATLAGIPGPFGVSPAIYSAEVSNDQSVVSKAAEKVGRYIDKKRGEKGGKPDEKPEKKTAAATAAGAAAAGTASALTTGRKESKPTQQPVPTFTQQDSSALLKQIKLFPDNLRAEKEAAEKALEELHDKKFTKENLINLLKTKHNLRSGLHADFFNRLSAAIEKMKK